MTDTNAESWKSYEEVAQSLLGQFASHFRLGRVEGKQVIPGKSGANWEIDAKGVKDNDEAFLIVECRRHTTSRLNQESVGGLAFRIKDTGAKGGILVTPLPLQSGAKKVADSANIEHVTLDTSSTTTDYVMSFLNRVFVGASITEHVKISETFEVRVKRNGKILDERKG